MAKGNYRLVCNREVVQKAFVWYKGALGDGIGTIGPVGARLEDAMPMLRREHIKAPNASQKKEILRWRSPGPRNRPQVDRERQFEAGRPEECLNRKATPKMPMDPTLFARITGPGKTPEASVALGYTGSDTVSNSSCGRLTCEGIHQELFLR
jgi:hypothetical protein